MTPAFRQLSELDKTEGNEKKERLKYIERRRHKPTFHILGKRTPNESEESLKYGKKMNKNIPALAGFIMNGVCNYVST